MPTFPTRFMSADDDVIDGVLPANLRGGRNAPRAELDAELLSEAEEPGELEEEMALEPVPAFRPRGFR